MLAVLLAGVLLSGCVSAENPRQTTTPTPSTESTTGLTVSDTTSGSADSASSSTAQPTEPAELTGLERVALLVEMYEMMNVEPCCGEDPGVGQVGVLGFHFGDNQIYVQSGDFAFLAQGLEGASPDVPDYSNDDGTVVLFKCGNTWYRLENLLAGSVAQVPEDALAAFKTGAGCS